MKCNFITFLFLGMLVSGCVLGPDYEIPSFDFADDYQIEDVEEASFPNTEIQQAWWKQFNDETLNELITEAVAHNYEIKAATANMEQVLASRGQAKRDFFPSFSGDAAATKSRSSSGNNSTATESNRFTAEGSVSWEIDLFGKLQRGLEAETALLEASKAEKHGVMLAVIAEMAQSYFEVRGLQKRITVTKHNVELLKEVERLAAIQLRDGIGSKLELSQAKGERQSFESRLPNLHADLKAAIYRISVLAGKAPEHYLDILAKHQPMPDVPDVIPVGLRADILRNRPDVALAERELAAANAEIGVAVAEDYPEISISGAVGTSARLFGDLFTSGAHVFTLGSALSWNLFDGDYDVEAQEAATKAQLANYRQTVLEALQEVETSLIRYGSEWQTLNALKAAQKTRKEGFTIAKLRYQEGEDDFLSIIDAERSLVTVEDEVIQSEIELLVRLVTLYKALGGGWQPHAAPLVP